MITYTDKAEILKAVIEVIKLLKDIKRQNIEIISILEAINDKC